MLFLKSVKILRFKHLNVRIYGKLKIRRAHQNSDFNTQNYVVHYIQFQRFKYYSTTLVETIVHLNLSMVKTTDVKICVSQSQGQRLTIAIVTKILRIHRW